MSQSMDRTLLWVTLLLVMSGLLFVYSASEIWALEKFHDAYFFVKRQLFFAVIGVVSMMYTASLPLEFWRRSANVLLMICFLLLILVLIPGIGLIRNGSQSWLGFSGFSLQPSEFMKLALVVFLARLLSDKEKTLKSFRKGLLPPLLWQALALLLIMLQPDLGSATVMILATTAVVVCAGAKWKHFAYLSSLGIISFSLLVLVAPYRLKRITAFLNPWADPLGAGFQSIQSLLAIGPSGLYGTGILASHQKHFYLPEPQTDFIFAIIAEETGFVGAVALILLFAFFVWRGFRIALYVVDPFAKLIAVGITMIVATQVFINISVVIGLIPVTGITLPFFSYGGSSLTLLLTSIGVLLQISRQVMYK